MTKRIISWFLLASLGCQKSAPPTVAVKPPEVIVARPVVREVQETEEFPGKFEATKSVELRAQVTGSLEAIHFADGADVTEGQKLFTIDSRVFRAELERANAGLAQAVAKRNRLKKDYDRRVTLGDAGSKEDLDRTAGELAEADSAIAVSQALVTLAKTQLDYCAIVAPFSGRASRRAIDPGNIVKANDTILTTIVATHPIHATFDVDERTQLRLKRIEKGIPGAKAVVSIALADEDVNIPPRSGEPGYRSGVVDFTDNQVNSGTGTIRYRVVVENPDRFLTPGLFCRLRFPIGQPRKALVIPEEAVGSDQGQKYVFVVNQKDEVVYRPVTLGFAVDRVRVVERGLEPTDRVIVRGQQRVRPGVTVTPKDG
jgi:multidrug efflux system membrane fusion protein